MLVDMGLRGEKSNPPLPFSSSNCAKRSSKRSLTPEEGVTMVVPGVEWADPGRVWEVLRQRRLRAGMSEDVDPGVIRSAGELARRDEIGRGFWVGVGGSMCSFKSVMQPQREVD